MDLENISKRSEVFKGSYVAQIPKINKRGLILPSVYELMKLRVEVGGTNSCAEKYYNGNHFIVSESIIYHPDGKRFKIVFDSLQLRNRVLNASSIDSDSLFLTSDDYNSLHGEEFEKSECGIINERMSKGSVTANPIWNFFAKRDKELLKDYVNLVFKKESDTGMGIYLKSVVDGDNFEMNLLYVDWLFDKSGVYCDCSVHDEDNLFLGRRPSVERGISKIDLPMNYYNLFGKLTKGLEKILYPKR